MYGGEALNLFRTSSSIPHILVGQMDYSGRAASLFISLQEQTETALAGLRAGGLQGGNP